MMIAVRGGDIPSILVERIGFAHPAPACFTAMEARDWADGVFRYLVERRILYEASRTKSMVCPGCERDCHKPVVVRVLEGEARSKAFIQCDEEPALGRIPIAFEMLTRWHASRSSLGSFVSEALGFGQLSWSLADPSVTLGNIKGRYNRRTVALCQSEGRMTIQVGRQQESVVRLLRWKGAGMVIDKILLRRLANRKEPTGGGQRLPSPAGPSQEWLLRKAQRNREILRQADKLKDEGLNWTQIAARIAQMPFIRDTADSFIDPSTIRRILSKYRAH
jgi:hypothetical protein